MKLTRIAILALSIFSYNSQAFAHKIHTVDYVIVGVGTSGAVLAKRLTDDKQTSVLALQNGKNYSGTDIIKFSKNAIYTVLDGIIGPPFYQNGNTIPQVDANNRALLWVLATPLGGASSINAGAYCRGTSQVYSQWEALDGPYWSVNRILDVYKSLENYHGQTTNPLSRGYFGPLNVRQNPSPSQVSLKFTQATINATGTPFVVDYNDFNTPIGVSSQVQYTQKGLGGVLRVSSPSAFLNKNVMTYDGHGVQHRKLRVLFKATALKVIWQGTTAIGVEYFYHGKFKKIYARKGVIVSAGLMSSPFLLRSGVGPASLLNSLGIPVIYNNPNVGQGLADQQRVVLLYSTKPEDTPLTLDISHLFERREVVSVIQKLSFGDLLLNRLKNIRKFKPLTECMPNEGLFTNMAWLPAPGGDPTIRALRISTANAVPGLTLVIFDLVQPQSRGSVSINSANPFFPPVVNDGVLSNSNDLDLYIKGFQVYINGINASLKVIDPEYQMIFPNPSIIDNTALLTDFIKMQIASNMHFQSHCRMAPLAQGGVVDSTGHVYGVQNLIVADNSIVPVGMDGSPMATAYLIGENISRILLNQ